MSSESTSDSEAVVLAVVDIVVFVVVKGNFSVVEAALPVLTESTLLMVGCGTTAAGSCCCGGWPATGGGSRGWSPYWGANWLEYCCWNCCTYGE